MPSVINPVAPSVFTAIANEMQKLQGSITPTATSKYTTWIFLGAAIFFIIYLVKKVK